MKKDAISVEKLKEAVAFFEDASAYEQLVDDAKDAFETALKVLRQRLLVAEGLSGCKGGGVNVTD